MLKGRHTFLFKRDDVTSASSPLVRETMDDGERDCDALNFEGCGFVAAVLTLPLDSVGRETG